MRSTSIDRRYVLLEYSSVFLITTKCLQNYSQVDYFNEFGSLIQALDADPNVNAADLLLGPSVSVNWTPESVLDASTGFIPTYKANLYGISVEQYVLRSIRLSLLFIRH